MKIHSSIKNAKIDTPLGPVIFGMQLPENVFQNCVKLADDVWARKNRIDWSHELVGHMKHQYYVPHSELKEYGLYDYFYAVLLLVYTKRIYGIRRKKEIYSDRTRSILD